MNAPLHFPPAAAGPGLALDRIGRGLADPVHGAQQVFRLLLSAQSHPGRIHRLPAELLAGMEAPAMGRALAAVLFTLLDAETGVWLPAAWHAAGAADWLRFHTGTRTDLGLAAAPFAATDLPALAGEAHGVERLWSQLGWGSDEAPQDGATLLLELPALTVAGPGQRVLRGPGIAETRALAAAGLEAAFWQARDALAPAYPRGVDLVLCCGDLLAALPRTTHVTQRGG